MTKVIHKGGICTARRRTRLRAEQQVCTNGKARPSSTQHDRDRACLPRTASPRRCGSTTARRVVLRQPSLDVVDEIGDLMEGRTEGFGSVPVHVALGATQWSTSLFPDKQRGTYVLPV